MPNTREKLIELLDVACTIANNKCGATACDDCDGRGKNGCTLYYVADHLIANGVTVQNRDIHWATERAYKNGLEAGKPKWIPVTERLPEDGIQVLVCTKHGKLFPAHSKYGKWRVSGSVTITHWMPLPEPPKGEMVD